MSVRAFAPGRVNLIGEHTDYNDGLCLPFAIGLGVTVEAAETGDERMSVEAVELDQTDAFALADPRPAEGWRAFARGIVAELRRTGPVTPAALRVTSTLPRGAGLSSSAALEVALALALLAHSGRPEGDRRELARLCSRVEHEWAGAQTGLLDQLACLFGEPDAAIRIDLRGLAIEPVPLRLDGWRLVTLDSGTRHENANSGYHERRDQCLRACELLGVATLRDADSSTAATLPAPLDRRARHVLDENERVDATVAALRADDLPAVGALLDAGHASLRDLFEISGAEVERTVEALKAAGAAGARLVGGGFGGSVLALFAPGTTPPAAAIAVAPGPAAVLREGR